MLDTARIRKWTHADIELHGTTWAGIATCLTWPQMGLSFDVAQGLPVAFNVPTCLVSHGHMDHAAGIPYLISQKALMGLPAARFVMPKAMVGNMREILRLWQELEGHQYTYDLVGVEAGDEVQIKPNVFVRAFATHHRVPSVGYTVFQRKKRLNPAWQGRSREELIQARETGEAIHDQIEEPILSYTGDTRIEFLDGPDWVRSSRVLVMEVTYFDEQRSIAQAREWGHIHMDELLPRLNELQCEKLLLIHLSSRYHLRQFRQDLKKRLPQEWQGRVDVFPR